MKVIIPKNYNCMRNQLNKSYHTRRSQAFLGTSTKSASRSFCSFSKSSAPKGPTKSSLVGLSLNEL